MTGQTRRTRTGSWPARSWLAASAAVLLVVAAVARLVLTEATADAAERRSGVSAGDGGAAAPGTLPAPAPGGTQSLPLLEGEPAPEPDAPAGASPPAGRFAGLAGLPHERFRGRVLDPDGQPLAGAVVYFVPAHAAFHALGHDLWWEHQLEPDELTRTSTDARGEFALDGPHVTRCVDGEQLGDTWAAEPGLIAWAPGYAAHPHVCIGYRGGPCDVGDLLVEAEARLHGRIVDEGGRPLEGVVVRYIVDQLDPARLPADAVRCEDDMLEIVQRARTDADGRFALGGLWQGLGQLRLTVESQVATAVQDIRPVSGQDLDVGTLTMSAGGSLAGVVVDAEGRPVPGAEVVLTGALGYRPRWPEVDLILEEQAFGDAFGRRLAVDDAGRFRAQGLEPEESFALFARSPAHDVALLDELRPGPGEQVLTPSPAATLRVEVLDAVDGAALPGAFVVARRIAARGDDEVLIPLAVEPAPDGEPGTWLVRRAGRVGTLLVVSAAGHTTQTHRADGLDAGARRDETVRLARELGVTGRVEDLDGAPIPAATVKASLPGLAEQGQFHDSWPTAATGEDGRYALAGVGAGAWLVQAEADGYVPADPVSVQVEDAPPVQDFVLTPAATIAGLALRNDGRPAAGAQISLQSWDAGTRTVGDVGRELPIDSAGRFRFEGLEAGAYRLHWAGSRIVSVEPGDRLELELREPRRPVVRVAVLDRGVRCDRAFVRVLRWTDTLGIGGTGWIPARPEGTVYRLELPEAGTYVLAALAKQGSAASDTATVTLDWGEERALELSLGATQVTGRLVSASSGEGLAAGWVTLRNADEEGLQLNARPGADGGFRFDGVVPGRYVLRLAGKDHLPRDLDPVEVPAQEQVELGPFALEQAARLRVELRSALGASGPEMAAVYVLDESQEQVVQIQVQRLDAASTFTLAAGRHWVVAVPSGGELDEEAWRKAPGRQSVELVGGQLREMLLVVQ